MSRKKWLTAHIDKELAAQVAENHSLDPFTALILVSRGITEYEDVEEFFDRQPAFFPPSGKLFKGRIIKLNIPEFIFNFVIIQPLLCSLASGAFGITDKLNHIFTLQVNFDQRQITPR